MFEVTRDWNYAAAVICSESAFIFRAGRARDSSSMKALSCIPASTVPARSGHALQ
jgi:hypothetical protein